MHTLHDSVTNFCRKFIPFPKEEMQRKKSLSSSSTPVHAALERIALFFNDLCIAQHVCMTYDI
jgi:hypothetical protein